MQPASPAGCLKFFKLGLSLKYLQIISFFCMLKFSYLNNYFNTIGRKPAMKTRIHTILISLMLAAALIAPMAVPADVFADSSSAGQTAAASVSHKTSKSQTNCGISIVFSNKVISDEHLQMAPSYLKATGKRKSIKLTWTPVTNTGGIDGYYILRRDLKGSIWRQIATVKASARSYTDKTAKKKNKCYRYSIVAFNKTGKNIMVSDAAAWAGALTTRSKKKNVYTCKYSNLANLVSVMTGSCAQAYLTFPKKAYSRSIRWSSSNNAVATVSSTGLVTGVSTGTATISARSHTGSISAFTVHVTKPGTAQAMVDTFYAWMGYNRINGYQHGIIDIYNSMTPWPAGYKMKYSDAWCDATITSAAIKTGNVERIGRECSVPRHVKIFQQMGIWQEDGANYVPKAGDIIVYSWKKAKQPNNSSPSHIGLVVKVENNQITCIEGNRGIGVVDTRTIPVGWGWIRGYATPNYVQ